MYGKLLVAMLNQIRTEQATFYMYPVLEYKLYGII